MKKLFLLFALLIVFSGSAQEKETTEIDWKAFRLKVVKASEELEQERTERLKNRYAELFEEADKEFHKQFYCPCMAQNKEEEKPEK